MPTYRLPGFGGARFRPDATVKAENFTKRIACLVILIVWMMVGCSHVATVPLPRDMAAEQLIATIKQTNIDLIQFKCVGKVTVSGPEQPIQSYRSAIAGQFDDRLRIDLFSPFGGAAGTIASDSEHLFLVLHATRKFYKKSFGNGSLRRFIKMDVTVGDLLELLAGRIPMDNALYPSIMPTDQKDMPGLRLVDGGGKTRQQIILDADGRPIRAQWFDNHNQQTRSLLFTGKQVIDGFVLPLQIDLSVSSGQTVTIRLDRYEANALIDDGLFVPPPISS